MAALPQPHSPDEPLSAFLRPEAKALPRQVSQALPPGVARHILRKTYLHFDSRNYIPIPSAGQPQAEAPLDAVRRNLHKIFPYWFFRSYTSMYLQYCYQIQPWFTLPFLFFSFS
ncbi:MAG: hypothetical protein J6F33_08645 [Acidaminococcaceae bacterium]|nr:hypothetical protein [Acidaminococcaceae bacterium]